jgi:hypothetical protein
MADVLNHTKLSDVDFMLATGLNFNPLTKGLGPAGYPVSALQSVHIYLVQASFMALFNYVLL